MRRNDLCDFIANLQSSLQLKEFGKSVNTFGEVTDKSIVGGVRSIVMCKLMTVCFCLSGCVVDRVLNGDVEW